MCGIGEIKAHPPALSGSPPQRGRNRWKANAFDFNGFSPLGGGAALAAGGGALKAGAMGDFFDFLMMRAESGEFDE